MQDPGKILSGSLPRLRGSHSVFLVLELLGRGRKYHFWWLHVGKGFAVRILRLEARRKQYEGYNTVPLPM